MTLHLSDLDRAENVIPVFHRDQTQERSLYTDYAKRLLDIGLVLLSLPFVLPLMILVAAAAMLDGRNPFYLQDRVGRGGRIFRILKFRTMVPDAEARLLTYLDENPEASREWAVNQKLKDDPRVTRVGAFLRRTSLDELPQLLNVLTGSMSLVGPRPMMVHQRGVYPGGAYYRLRPGITGLWQVSDRNHCSFAERATFDEEYSRMISLATDLRLLFRTVIVVLRGTGC